MIKADPNAGAYYVCNPNNPTGTVAARKDIIYLLENKPGDAIVILDEAYIHFWDTAEGGSDLVSPDKERNHPSNIFKSLRHGRTACRCRSRPSRLAGKASSFGTGFLPISDLACATASMSVKNLVPERRQICNSIREDTFAFLDKKNVKYVPSETNFFMMQVNRPGTEFAAALADQKVINGRVWPVWPTKVRVRIGTQAEMNKFKSACEKVWAV